MILNLVPLKVLAFFDDQLQNNLQQSNYLNLRELVNNLIYHNYHKKILVLHKVSSIYLKIMIQKGGHLKFF